MRPKTQTATIAINETESSAIELDGDSRLVGLYLPASLTSTTMSFKVSYDNSTFLTLYDEGASYNVTVAASRYIALKPAACVGARWVKLVAGSSEAAARSIVVAKSEVA